VRAQALALLQEVERSGLQVSIRLKTKISYLDATSVAQGGRHVRRSEPL